MNARNESKPPEDDDSEDTIVLMAETPIPPIQTHKNETNPCGSFCPFSLIALQSQTPLTSSCNNRHNQLEKKRL